jgi:tetratricopeptide (TPR) repeat protein
MQLRFLPLTFALTLAGLLSVPALARPENSASADLLRSAHMWEAKDRPDLARVMLEKLLTIESNPEVLFMLGSIELRSGNIKLAGEYLHRLEQRYPHHPKTLSLRSLYRVNTTEKQTLANARLMARAGNTKEAANIMRRLFPEAPPPGELGLEYYQLVNSTAADQQTAKSALDKLYRETGEARYRLAWLKLQNNQRSKQEILLGYEALAAAPDVNRQKLRESWWATINRLTATPANLPWVRRYLKEFPSDQKAIEYLAELQQLHDNALRIANDPAVRARQTGIAFLEHGQLEDAQRELEKSLLKRPKDPKVLGSIGLLRLRQGRHEEAKNWFQRAAKVEPNNQWRGLIRTASFWSQIKRANALLEAGKLAEAQQFARQALNIEPNNADGLALLGDILARSQNLAGAESLYRDALKRDAGNTSAMRGLLALLSRSERRDEAQALIAKFRQNNLKEANRFNESQASLLRDEAEAFISAHRPSHALLALETAVQLAPRDAWIRHDLANLYESLGLQTLSRRVMAEGVELAPDDFSMNYAYALVLTAQAREIEALQRLAHIPPSARSSAMNELETHTWIKLRIRQATKLQAGGRKDEAIRMLLLAERHAANNNPSAIEQLSEGWFSLEQPARGLALMKRHLIDTKSATMDSQLYYASLLNRAKQDDTLNIFLPELQQRPEWNDKQRETMLAIETDLTARQIEQLLQRGQIAQARTLAARAVVVGRAGDISTLKAQARLLLEANDWKAALLILQAILDKHPDDLESRLNLAQAHAQAGEKQAAQEVINQLLPRLHENDVDIKLSIIRLETRLGNMDRARKIMTKLLTSNPDNLDVLIQAGRIERSDRRYSAALAYFRQALILERRASGMATTAESVPLLDLDPKHPIIGLAPQPGYALGYPNAVKTTGTADKQKSVTEFNLHSPLMAETIINPDADIPLAPSIPELGKTALVRRPTRAEEEIARIETRRDPRIEIGFEKLSRNSSNGTSTYHGTETPIVGWWPVGYDGHGFVHVDQVSVNAGQLTQADAPLFGKLGVRPSPLPPPFAQKVDGTSVGVGYEGDALRWDLGVIGIGFPVQNMVGGIRKGWEVNKVDYALEIFRRPQTNSLLSYAGTRDPATGEIWGGIAYTGVGGRLAHTFGQFNTFASAEYGLLRGKNVLDNNRLALRTGIDKDVLRRENMWVNLGLTLTHWRYKENESFYTFGHGGYYSPQSYTSVNLPVEWAGRSGKLSYLVRGSTSYSWTNEKRMPYYPTDSALQSDAVTSGNNIDLGFYPGGPGGGKGYSLRLATEYQVTPHLAIGGYHNMDRTAFYTPNLTFIYLRYLFKAHSEPVRFPPITAKPYSRF